ncbi:MAG TPA: hypothetical protein VN626_08845 [Clostridia bacterium]|nr:hypothetical protein [Clostridia bacterium]
MNRLLALSLVCILLVLMGYDATSSAGDALVPALDSKMQQDVSETNTLPETLSVSGTDASPPLADTWEMPALQAYYAKRYQNRWTEDYRGDGSGAG